MSVGKRYHRQICTLGKLKHAEYVGGPAQLIYVTQESFCAMGSDKFASGRPVLFSEHTTRRLSHAITANGRKCKKHNLSFRRPLKNSSFSVLPKALFRLRRPVLVLLLLVLLVLLRASSAVGYGNINKLMSLSAKNPERPKTPPLRMSECNFACFVCCKKFSVLFLPSPPSMHSPSGLKKRMCL